MGGEGVTGTAIIGVEGATGATGATVATIGEPDKSTSSEGTPGIFVCMVDHIIVSTSLFRGTEVTVF